MEPAGTDPEPGRKIMLRHRCAACGQPINRLDSFFEPSDGTLCASCLARVASGKPRKPAPMVGVASPLPEAWSVLPELSFASRQR
jgi:hypothetical protein